MNDRKTYCKPVLVLHGTISDMTSNVKTQLAAGDGIYLRTPNGDEPIGWVS